MQIQQLYFDIDLSSHNATVKSTCYGYPQLPVPLNFIERQWTDLDREIRERQDLFIRTILDKPDIGKKVRHLKWTVLPSADDLWPDEVMMDRYDEAFLRDEEVLAVYPPEDGECLMSDMEWQC